MKKILLFMIIVLSVPAMISAKSTDRLGAGIIIGEPTGISLKYSNFPVLGIAWSVENHFHVHCDYWVHEDTLKAPVNWYVGVGGKVRLFTNDSNDRKKDSDSDIGLGFRVPVGLQYYIIEELELFGEIVPGISLFPATGFDLDAGIGIRYYF